MLAEEATLTNNQDRGPWRNEEDAVRSLKETTQQL